MHALRTTLVQHGSDELAVQRTHSHRVQLLLSRSCPPRLGLTRHRSLCVSTTTLQEQRLHLLLLQVSSQ